MSQQPSAKDIQATVQFLKQFNPFDQMQSEHLVQLATKAKLNFYAKDQKIITAEHIRLTHILIIKEGHVTCLDHDDDETHYTSG